MGTSTTSTPTTLQVTKVERAGRVFTLHCEHPVLVGTHYAVALPALLVKQLAGLLIHEEGLNEQKQAATQAIVVPGALSS